ncbi:MAG TPA: PIG-L family deacetylase, partial [Devosia sp.]|nr:PIG-L family deacetylase [Devosia sp.]
MLDADIAWLGHGPDDPVHDFGFSKSGPDTLARWGKARTIERLVRAYRKWRPDIVIPTFLDVPGQHGHHRAMTEAAETALALAADPTAYPEHFAEGLSVWQVAKYYLPAWSGGGEYYDDEVPPPPATVSVTADGNDAASGAPYDMVGEFSRAFHGSQVMGHWRAEPVMSWPLHLLHGAAENDIRADLPATLGELAERVSGVAAAALREAQARIDEAMAAFPHGQGITGALIAARGSIVGAQSALSAAESVAFGHRLERKLAEIDAALLLSAGFAATAWVEPANVAPGGEAVLKIALQPGQAQNIALSAVTAPFITVTGAANGEAVVSIPLRVAADAPISNAFLPDFVALGGNGLLSVALTGNVAGQQVQLAIDLEEALQIVPPASVELTPEAVIVPLGQSVTRTIRIRSDAARERISIDGADHLALTATATGLELSVHSDLATGRHSLAARLDGQQAYAMSPIDYPHIGRTHFVRPQALEVLALKLIVPTTRIGYVGAG